MQLVLLSGGSGKRLWPLSNDSRSKQFLKVLTTPDGEPESMVQRVWRQLAEAGLQGNACIATGRSQVDALQSQIGSEAPVIVEPSRRDTYPAIALAATYLYSVKGVGLNEVVAVLPVDPFVQSGFYGKLRQLERILLATDANLALIGVKPSHPSEKYGYIVPGRERDRALPPEAVEVERFIEKPREAAAQELIRQDALWNCGVFAFRLHDLINYLIRAGLPIQFDEMRRQYGRLPAVSFDYEVVERAAHVAAVVYEGDWKDLGTWNTLTEEMGGRQIGKGILAAGCENTHLINELDIPVTVMGLPDAIVAASPDGILVSSKAASPGIKEVMKHTEQRPMYEERRWGWYKVLDCGRTAEGEEVLTKRICVLAGKHISYQTHHKRSEVWTIISGTGEFILNDKWHRVKSGDVLHIPLGAKHSIKAERTLEFIEVQTGKELVEEDIVRLSLSWEEMLRHCS